MIEQTDPNYSRLIALFQDPGKSTLRGLRHTIPGGIESVSCDICSADCFDKHLNWESSWKNLDRTYLGADICPKCVNEHLVSIIKFRCL